MSSRKVAGANIFLSLRGVQTLAVTTGCQQHELLQQQHLLLQCYLLKTPRVQDLDGCVFSQAQHFWKTLLCACSTIILCRQSRSSDSGKCGQPCYVKGSNMWPFSDILKGQTPAVQKGNFTRRLISEAQELPVLISSPRSK